MAVRRRQQRNSNVATLQRELRRAQRERDTWRKRFEELASICRAYDRCREDCGPRKGRHPTTCRRPPEADVLHRSRLPLAATGRWWGHCRSDCS